MQLVDEHRLKTPSALEYRSMKKWPIENRNRPIIPARTDDTAAAFTGWGTAVDGEAMEGKSYYKGMHVRTLALTGATILIAAGVAALWSAPRKNLTPADAKSFLDKTESDLEKLTIDSNRAGWVKSTFIPMTPRPYPPRRTKERLPPSVRAAKEAADFSKIALDPASERRLKLLEELPHPRHSRGSG